MNAESRDERFMRRALDLAVQGLGRVEPNPMVGAVVVRGERIVGEGYHARFGGPHAEVVALREAGEAARGAELFVSLEPCCHHGKTPPCTDAVVAAGVRRVVAAVRDPFPEVCGRGLELLVKAGVEVRSDVLATEARCANAAFFKRQATGLPLVIAKWAMSLDGCLSAPSGASRWISCEASRRRVHELRRVSDAVLVGAAGFAAGGGLVFTLGLLAFAAHLSWQIVKLDIADPDNCLTVFKSDRDAGLILFAGLVLQAALAR